MKNQNLLLYKASHFIFIFKLIILIWKARIQKVRRRGKFEQVLGKGELALCFWRVALNFWSSGGVALCIGKLVLCVSSR